MQNIDEENLKFIYRVHAVERMFQRDITDVEIEYVIQKGDIVEKYLDDKPYPSYLVHAKISTKNIHVVFAKDEDGSIIIITVYQPSLEIWNDDYITRKAK